jgi:hypothetical protein
VTIPRIAFLGPSSPSDSQTRTGLHALRDTLPKPSLPDFHAPAPLSVLSLTKRSQPASRTPSPQPPSPPSAKNGFDKLSGNVVVLGGYRGSILRDARDGKRLWVPLKVPLGLRKPDLSIGLSDAAEAKTAESIIASGMLMCMAGVLDLGKSLKSKFKGMGRQGKIHFINVRSVTPEHSLHQLTSWTGTARL